MPAPVPPAMPQAVGAGAGGGKPPVRTAGTDELLPMAAPLAASQPPQRAFSPAASIGVGTSDGTGSLGGGGTGWHAQRHSVPMSMSQAHSDALTSVASAAGAARRRSRRGSLGDILGPESQGSAAPADPAGPADLTSPRADQPGPVVGVGVGVGVGVRWANVRMPGSAGSSRLQKRLLSAPTCLDPAVVAGDNDGSGGSGGSGSGSGGGSGGTPLRPRQFNSEPSFVPHGVTPMPRQAERASVDSDRGVTPEPFPGEPPAPWGPAALLLEAVPEGTLATAAAAEEREPFELLSGAPVPPRRAASVPADQPAVSATDRRRPPGEGMMPDPDRDTEQGPRPEPSGDPSGCDDSATLCAELDRSSLAFLGLEMESSYTGHFRGSVVPGPVEHSSMSGSSLMLPSGSYGSGRRPWGSGSSDVSARRRSSHQWAGSVSELAPLQSMSRSISSGAGSGSSNVLAVPVPTPRAETTAVAAAAAMFAGCAGTEAPAAAQPRFAVTLDTVDGDSGVGFSRSRSPQDTGGDVTPMGRLSPRPPRKSMPAIRPPDLISPGITPRASLSETSIPLGAYDVTASPDQSGNTASDGGDERPPLSMLACGQKHSPLFLDHLSRAVIRSTRLFTCPAPTGYSPRWGLSNQPRSSAGSHLFIRCSADPHILAWASSPSLPRITHNYPREHHLCCDCAVTVAVAVAVRWLGLDLCPFQAVGLLPGLCLCMCLWMCLFLCLCLWL